MSLGNVHYLIFSFEPPNWAKFFISKSVNYPISERVQDCSSVYNVDLNQPSSSGLGRKWCFLLQCFLLYHFYNLFFVCVLTLWGCLYYFALGLCHRPGSVFSYLLDSTCILWICILLSCKLSPRSCLLEQKFVLEG